MNITNKISVIVPVYNAEQYLKQCIDNLMCQTYKNIEIIIVDDGSTDNTANIVKQYNVKYLYQENKGDCMARNFGLENAIGDYVHFLDIDDLINVEFYENMMREAIETDAEMACCSFIFERYQHQSQIYNYKFIASDIEDKLALTNVHIYGACWRYIYKRLFLIEKNLIFENGRTGFDRVFSLKAVYLANKIISVPNSVYIYKNRENSITTSRSISSIKKRHADRKASNLLLHEFAIQHNLSIKRKALEAWKYKFLGLTILSKKVINKGNIKWYFIGINIFQKKEV
jgi:glycosyltransferase involved in cell wall biosynthesis